MAKRKSQPRTSGSKARARRGRNALKAPIAVVCSEPLSAEVTGSEEAYNRFLPAGTALYKRDVVPFRADASLAYVNVTTGLSAVLSREEQVRDELLKFNLADARALPDLALGVAFAASQVDRDAPSAGTTRALLSEARAIRDLMLTYAEALAKAGIIAARPVAKIREGRGPIDTAQDCIDLAALFRKYGAQTGGKTAVSADHIRGAAEVGTELVTVLRPRTAPRKQAAPRAVQAAAGVRERLYTLLVQRHERLRRAGVWLFGEASVDRHVPLLQSRAAAPPKKRPVAPARAGSAEPARAAP